MSICKLYFFTHHAWLVWSKQNDNSVWVRNKSFNCHLNQASFEILRKLMELLWNAVSWLLFLNTWNKYYELVIVQNYNTISININFSHGYKNPVKLGHTEPLIFNSFWIFMGCIKQPRRSIIKSREKKKPKKPINYCNITKNY